MILKKGFVQIYTGKGKGKTTAALGLALRGAGAGLRVYFGQFLKSGNYSENHSIPNLGKNIVVESFGSDTFISSEPTIDDIRHARLGLNRAKEVLSSKKFDIVILDEINYALSLGLIDENEVAEMIKNRPIGVELVLTGVDAPASIIELADLITEMKDVRHYFNKGVNARVGIEK